MVTWELVKKTQIPYHPGGMVAHARRNFYEARAGTAALWMDLASDRASPYLQQAEQEPARPR